MHVKYWTCMHSFKTTFLAVPTLPVPRRAMLLTPTGGERGVSAAGRVLVVVGPGCFSAGTPGRVRHIIVAAAALLLAVHEARVAYGIAEKSHSKTLHLLASPFAALAATIDGIRGKFARGQGSPADLATLNSTARSNGFGAIKDVTTPLPRGS